MPFAFHCHKSYSKYQFCQIPTPHNAWNIGLSYPCPPHPLFRPQNVNFLIFMQFLAISHKLSPTSWFHLGNPVMCVCKEGWFIRLGQEGVAFEIVEETVWNNLKGGGIEKRARETKILKMCMCVCGNGGGAGWSSGVGALKEVGAEPPYELWSLTNSIASECL